MLLHKRPCLTGELSHRRVSAILTRHAFDWRRGRGGGSPIGQTRTEVIVANETETAAMPGEARIVRKVRMRIIPFVFLLYIISFLDRINIGFAALTMNKELAITAKQFGLVAGIFFFGYFLFEIPSNLLLHKLGARIWIGEFWPR